MFGALSIIPVACLTRGDNAPVSPLPYPTLQPIGVNFSGLDFGGLATNAVAPSQAQFDYMAGRGVKRARIPFRWNYIQPQLFGPLDQAFLTKILQSCQRAYAADMQVMLDNHSFGAHQGSGKIGNGVVTGEHLGDCWVKLDAELRSANVDVYAYDIMNEPSNMPDATAWEIGAQAAINMIREVNSDVLIVMEGNGFSGAWDWTTNNPTIHTVTDPAGKMVWSAHTYLDRDSSGTHFDWDEEVAAGSVAPPGAPIDDQIGIVRVQTFINWLTLHGFSGHIGELGASELSADWMAPYEAVIEHCLNNNVPVDAWAGGTWPETYALAVTPFANGKQRRAVTVLTKFTGAAQPSTYWTTVPTRGVAGEPIDVLVEYRGTTAQTITVTLSDNGAGGTFSQNPIVLSAGDDPELTVTYTNASEKRVTISATNNRGLTNPSDKVVSTVNDLFVQAAATVEPNNVFSFRRKYTPYTGPCVRLRKENGAESDFGFDSNGYLDRQAVADWAVGSLTYLHTWYDQSPNARHMTRNQTDRRSWPIFHLDDENGRPVVYFGDDTGRGKQMNFSSPINGAVGHTVMLRVRYQAGAWGLNWNFTSNYDPLRTTTEWEYLDDVNGVTYRIPHGLTLNAFSQYATRFVADDPAGFSVFREGVLSGSSPSTGIASILIENGTSTARIGYFRFAAVYWTGYIGDLIVYREALSDAAIAAFQADEASAVYPAITHPANTVFSKTGLSLPATWRGVNCSGYENSTSNPLDSAVGFNHFPPTQPSGGAGLSQRLDYWQSKGMTLVRLALPPHRVQQRPFGPLSEYHLAQIWALVDGAGTRNMRVILEPHAYANWYNYAAAVQGRINTPSRRAEFADWWARMAAAFKDCENVVFNLMNEPSGSITAAEWRVSAEQAIAAIRGTGATNQIQIPGVSFTGAHSWISSGNAAAWAGYNGDANFVYEMHQYLDSDNSGTKSTCQLGAGAVRLNAATNWLAAEGQRAFLGEVGWTSSVTCVAEAQDILQYMNDRPGQWLGWAYWADGPVYSGSLSINPTYTAGVPNADKPQMTTLIPYL